MCNLKIWIKETSLSKARVVVTENIVFKYQKQATIAASNGEDVHMLLPTGLKKLWIYQVLPFILRKLILLRKNENSSEKETVILKVFFSSRSKSDKKRKVFKTEVVIQSLAINCYHKFHLSSHKDLEMLILAAPFSLQTKIILKWPYMRSKVQLWGEIKNHEWK